MLTEDIILKEVCLHYDVPEKNLFSKRHHHYPYEEARNAYIYLCREFDVCTCAKLAVLFKCGTRAMYYRLSQFRKRIETASLICRDINYIKEKLKNYK